MRIMGVWTLMFVSTKGNRGHTHTVTASWGASKKEPVANESGETRDCGGDARAGSLGIAGGTTARRECQPGVPLANAVSVRTPGNDNHQPAGATLGRAWIDRDRERFHFASTNHGNSAPLM